MHTKMSREDRAKQFMPFAALKGYEEALRAKERIVVDRKELSEEKMKELDDIIHQVNVQDMVSIVHYEGDEYVRTVGMVSKLDYDSRTIKVVSKKILFDEIYSIEIM